MYNLYTQGTLGYESRRASIAFKPYNCLQSLSSICTYTLMSIPPRKAGGIAVAKAMPALRQLCDCQPSTW